MSLDVRDITAGLSCERQQCLLRIVYGVGVKEEEVFFFQLTMKVSHTTKTLVMAKSGFVTDLTIRLWKHMV